MPAESRLYYRKPQNSAQTQTELEGLENVLSEFGPEMDAIM